MQTESGIHRRKPVADNIFLKSMKEMKIYRILFAAMAATAVWACDDEALPATEPFTLSVDKSEIQSDGQDAATFTITDANGLVLTEGDYLKNTSFNIVETKEWQSGVLMKEPHKFMTITDGSYTIKAMYNGKYCSNEVKIKSVNRRSYEKFHKNVAIYRLTGTWCGYCPTMTDALEQVNTFTKGHSIVMAFHNNDEFSLKVDGNKDLAKILWDRYGAGGLPYAIYSLAEGSGNRKISEIEDFVKKQLYSNPARTGIKASSAVNSNTISVTAKVNASVGGTYDLGMAILRDGRKAEKGGNEPVYDNVVTSISGNFYAMSSDSTFNLDADAEKEITKTVEISDLATIADDCRVVLFTLRKEGNGVLIDNAVDFKVGGSIDYILN